MTTYILDTETTGLVDPHMTEVAYSIIGINSDGTIKVKQEPRAKRYNPLKSISIGAMATSHICDEDVENEPPHTEFKLPDTVSYIIGHNIDFDMLAIRNTGNKHEPKRICTKALATYLLPELDSHKLTALLYHFHRDIARKEAVNAHAAEVDIYFTQLVLQSLINEAIKQGHKIASMEDLYQLSQTARKPIFLSFGKYRGARIDDLALMQDGSSYLKWLASRDNIDPYLLEAIKDAFAKRNANTTT